MTFHIIIIVCVLTLSCVDCWQEETGDEVAPYMEKRLIPLSTFKVKAAEIVEEYFSSEDVAEVLT